MVVDSATERRSIVLYGTLAPRKGIDRLAAALARESSGYHVVLAGPAVSDAYAREIDGFVAVMRQGGATVELRRWSHQEPEALALLRQARCAVLPYHRHGGASRVLLESAASGTPVVAHDYGLVAALVKRHRLGRVVDCGDPAAFRRALIEVSADGEIERYGSALRRFANRYSGAMFSAALREPFGLKTPSPKKVGVATR
jgi:glycosyltransferase involved in cell wall biosynthesis